jgi:hypothetical protein
LISGYHSVTPFPKEARKSWLFFRFALVFESYRRDKVDLFFNSELFLSLLGALSLQISHNRLEIYYDSGESRREKPLVSFGALEEYYQNVSEVEREPPHKILWFQDHLLVCMGLSELWARVGGPEPYSDSYTMSLYTKKDYTSPFRSICEEVCQRINTQIVDFIQGRPNPS